MKQAKQDVPVRIDTPDAVARQQMGFGDAGQYGELSGEYFTLAAGTDITPLLQGLENDSISWMSVSASVATIRNL
ncbi:MAG: hypothetical protein V5A41_13625, partial [Haloarculaceae archaeon]